MSWNFAQRAPLVPEWLGRVRVLHFLALAIVAVRLALAWRKRPSADHPLRSAFAGGL